MAAWARPINVPNLEHERYPAPPHLSLVIDATLSKFQEHNGF